MMLLFISYTKIKLDNEDKSINGFNEEKVYCEGHVRMLLGVPMDVVGCG